MAKKSWKKRNSKKKKNVKDLNFHTLKDPPTDYTVTGQSLCYLFVPYTSPQYLGIGLFLSQHLALFW